MPTLIERLASALHAIAIEHGALQPNGTFNDGCRRSPASGYARAALAEYVTYAAAKRTEAENLRQAAQSWRDKVGANPLFKNDQPELPLHWGDINNVGKEHGA
jgi:hypothetical protein